MKYLEYLKYLLRHKWYTGLECLRHGLFWEAVTHDLSKFLPDEFFPYCEHFYGGPHPRYSDYYKKYGDMAESYRRIMDENKPWAEGVKAAWDRAWALHLKRNSHHWQHHVVTLSSGQVIVLDTHPRLAVYMYCDWVGSSRAQGKGRDVLPWYEAHKADIILAPGVKEELLDLLVKGK